MTEPVTRLNAALKGRYRIERELGQGGMATVYLAYDLKHDREVAIKVLRQELAQNLGPDRFLQEVKLAASLQHPHIVPLYDSGEADGFLFYVMPRIKGESLRERLDREGEIPVADAIRILRQVADALTHAHGQGVVHRDIKPDNVMVTGRHALVTDFGVAKAVSEATGRSKLTTVGVALGTPSYMSPEQAAADPNIDHRADIYAFGAMGYELLTGRPPFVGDTHHIVLSAHMTQAPDPVTDHRSTTPPALGQLVMKCLEKRAADRWQSAEALLVQLDGMVTPSTGVTPMDTAPLRMRSRWFRPVLVGTVAVAAAVLGAVWLVVDGGGESSPDAIQRIAVLPMENATGDAEQDFFADGMTRELIGVLTQAGIRVVGYRAVARFGDSDLALADIAEELDVDAVAVGSVLRAGPQVELSIELTHPATQENLWADTYAGEAAEVLTLRNDIARQIARAIQTEITPAQDTRFATARTVEPEAYREFLLGQQQAYRWTREGFRRSVDHFERAIALDSTFAPAHAELAQTYTTAFWYGWVFADSARSRVETAVNRALTLDDRLAEAYVARAKMEWSMDWDFEKAEASLQRAIPLSRAATTYDWYAVFLWMTGRFEEAVRTLGQAIELEPTTVQWHGDLGWFLLSRGDTAGALEATLLATRLDPTFAEAHEFLAMLYFEQGRFDDSRAALDEAERLYGAVESSHRSLRIRLDLATGEGARAMEMLADLESSTGLNGLPAYPELAEIRLAMEQPDSAITLLERAVVTRDPGALYALRANTLWAPYRAHPRFQALLRRAGL